MRLLDNISGQKASKLTKFYKTKGFKNWKFKFVAFDSKFNSYSDKYNDALYNGDVCEVFIRYGKENHYYEIEVAPNGTIFLSDIKNIDDKFSGQFIDACFIKATSKICKGKYIIKILVPKDKIKTKKLQFNAYRIDTDGEIPNKHLYALHPTMCETFHINKSIH